VYVFTRRIDAHPPEIYPYTIVHELAHFVAGAGGGPGDVLDHSYHLRADFDRLPPRLAVHTADCYSQFAAEAALHRQVRFRRLS
jgi:hypothetical protein